ncbi:MAG: hypothetical protein QXO09_05575 [Candidatus Caldarchaeum sp.]
MRFAPLATAAPPVTPPTPPTNGGVFWGPIAHLADAILYVAIATAGLIVALTGLRAVLTANLGDTTILRIFIFKRLLGLVAALALVILAPNIANWVSERIGNVAANTIPEWLRGLYDFIRGFLAPIAKAIFALSLQLDGLRKLFFMLQYWESPEADESATIVNRVIIISALLILFEFAPLVAKEFADAVKQ